jgi:hypothetical protein
MEKSRLVLSAAKPNTQYSEQNGHVGLRCAQPNLQLRNGFTLTRESIPLSTKEKGAISMITPFFYFTLGLPGPNCQSVADYPGKYQFRNIGPYSSLKKTHHSKRVYSHNYKLSDAKIKC